MSSTQEKLRLSESAYESILRLIFSGELEPGQSISELKLSRKLEISRTPVHEAVNQLVYDGLLVQEANHRPYVAEFSSDDVYDIFEMRKLLEGEAAARAAERIDRMTLTHLLDQVEAFRDSEFSEDAVNQWVTLDDEFHATIANSSGSRRLVSDILRYRRLHRVFNRTHSDATVLTQAVEEHLAILECLKDRNPEEARSVMIHHIAEWQRFFIQHLS